MNTSLPSGVIHVRDVYLWAHVGVLEKERLLGQKFSLDFSVWVDLNKAAANDELSSTADYSIGIKKIQELSFRVNCQTLEHFSDQILDCLETLYGCVPMKVNLRKCAAPIAGFSGIVEIQRQRYFSR